MKIDDFKADDQDTLEEKTKQNEKAVRFSMLRNDVNVNVDGSEVDVDGKYLDKENLKDINGELLKEFQVIL